MPPTFILMLSSLEYSAALVEAIYDPSKKLCSKCKNCWRAVFTSGPLTVVGYSDCTLWKWKRWRLVPYTHSFHSQGCAPLNVAPSQQLATTLRTSSILAVRISTDFTKSTQSSARYGGLHRMFAIIKLSSRKFFSHYTKHRIRTTPARLRQVV